MTKLQQHYINFQSQPTIPQKILYLQNNQKELSTYNINIPNLISIDRYEGQINYPTWIKFSLYFISSIIA